MFVGTGKSNTNFDIELWKDIVRLKPNDKIVFFVQSLKKFYGFFEVASNPFFDANHYLQDGIMPFIEIKKSNGQINYIKLQYRALIRPFNVFQNGIDEFDLVDILPQSSKDVLWNVLYRKLKGTRGCSPLFESEFNTIFHKIATINNNQPLNSNSFTFSSGQMIPTNQNFVYTGTTTALNIKQNINWLGNEVYSGAGMQAMDILTIDNRNVFNIYEIKKDEIPNNIIEQISKYINWLKHRFQCFNNSAYQPIAIGKRILGQRMFANRIRGFNNFNALNISLPLVYIEYVINNQNNTVDFYQYNYVQNTHTLLWTI